VILSIGFFAAMDPVWVQAVATNLARAARRRSRHATMLIGLDQMIRGHHRSSRPCQTRKITTHSSRTVPTKPPFPRDHPEVKSSRLPKLLQQ
jgi:hypothetical protein